MLKTKILLSYIYDPKNNFLFLQKKKKYIYILPSLKESQACLTNSIFVYKFSHAHCLVHCWIKIKDLFLKKIKNYLVVCGWYSYSIYLRPRGSVISTRNNNNSHTLLQTVPPYIGKNITTSSLTQQYSKYACNFSESTPFIFIF